MVEDTALNVFTEDFCWFTARRETSLLKSLSRNLDASLKVSAQDSQSDMDSNGKINDMMSVKPLISDSTFLLNFIMSNYLGPDVKSEKPICSAAQRLVAGLPPYTSSDLGPSYVSISLLERLYYHVLRDAQPNLVLEQSMLHMYLKGNLFLPSSESTEDNQQFTDFFPLNLHQQIWYPDSFRIVKAVVLIVDPVTSYIKEEDMKRFKYLTGVNNLKVDINECLHTELGNQARKEGEDNCINKEQAANSNGQCPQFQQKCKRKYFHDSPPIPEFPCVFPIKHDAKRDPSNGPTLMPLLSIPHIQDCDIEASLHLTGTAIRGLQGPPVGVVDIGISKSAYLFRVALPGVTKDHGQFSCEIESDGRVHIRGLLTGGRTIRKQSRVFEMKVHHLCPPGPFTLSFSLPGAVDPRLLAPNFRMMIEPVQERLEELLISMQGVGTLLLPWLGLEPSVVGERSGDRLAAGLAEPEGCGGLSVTIEGAGEDASQSKHGAWVAVGGDVGE
ncbi:increased DNA methylation 3-like isoform X1 [Senna tora]|uniref:Increased DNA methylation 3-like isoform X1 n=1 Tax=Senna tora TaxID=362788 RepID=A0A834SJD4_9FABA|nr:increased DNA methylation 3-like isoform X1 [Senna tora]